MTNIRDLQLTDRMIRRKADTADDPDYQGDVVDATAFYLTVGGVADDGDLTVSVDPVDTQRYPTPDDVAFTREAGETLNQSAEGLHDAFVTALATVNTTTTSRVPDLARYIKRVEYTAATAVVRVIPQPDAPRFTVTVTGTGGTMTLTLSPDDTFPITFMSARQVGANVGASGEVAVTLHEVTSADEILAVATCTCDVQFLRVNERRNAVTHTDLRPGIADLGTLTGVTMGEEIRVPAGGGRIGMRITNIANTSGTFDALWVVGRDTVT